MPYVLGVSRYPGSKSIQWAYSFDLEKEGLSTIVHDSVEVFSRAVFCSLVESSRFLQGFKGVGLTAFVEVRLESYDTRTLNPKPKTQTL